MTPSTRLTLILLTSLAVTACGGGRQGIYIDSTEAEPLRVPENLDRPSTGSALFVPGVSAPELAGLRDAAKPPLVLSSEEASASGISIGYGDGALYMLIKDTPRSVYRRLGFALNRGHMSLREQQPEGMAYDFFYRQPPETKPKQGFFGGLWDVLTFWSGSEEIDYSGNYRVKIQADDNNPSHARVYLYDVDDRAAGSDRADLIFTHLQRRLG